MWIDQLIMEQCHKQVAYASWVPDSVFVVLGNANHFEKECRVEHCKEDNINVLKRSGGGGTVVLHPGCAILSVGVWLKHYYRNAEYFRSINNAVIQSLEAAYPEFHPLSQNGISDITLKGRKVAGTSLFRSRNYLLYQASILVDSKLEIIERYLAHPSKEPEYREGKSHSEFLTSLREFKKDCKPEHITDLFLKEFPSILEKELAEDLMEPQAAQWEYLRKRFGSRTSI